MARNRDAGTHLPIQAMNDVVCSCSVGDRRGAISWTAEHYEREAAKLEPMPSWRRTPFPEGCFGYKRK